MADREFNARILFYPAKVAKIWARTGQPAGVDVEQHQLSGKNNQE